MTLWEKNIHSKIIYFFNHKTSRLWEKKTGKDKWYAYTYPAIGDRVRQMSNLLEVLVRTT